MSGKLPRVLVAGGGVAGLEAVLALRHLLGERVHIEVLAPEAEFAYRQFAVAEPFSMGEVSRFDLAALVRDAGAIHRQDALRAVDAERRVAETDAGAEIHFDYLVLAIGGSARSALPGATIYRGPLSNTEVHGAILAIDRGESRSIAFAIPATVHWGLPAYELALLSAAHLSDIGVHDAPVHLIAGEHRPLDFFGDAASERIRGLLAETGVTVHAGVAPARVSDRGVVLVDGSVVDCDRVFALPALEVRAIAGIEQGPHGFIATDSRMQVDGLEHVYAVGDAASFPIKQGGLAAQQADVAAAAIAVSLDAEIENPPFRPRMRAALLTADGPLYLRSGDQRDTQGASSETPLWWPPGKVAGTYLTPFVAARAAASNQPDPALLDLEPGSAGDADDHRAAIELALYGAEADARHADYKGALRWLAVAERLDLTLPAEYALRREQWQQLGR